MRTIQNAMRSFFVILHLAAIKNVLARMYRKQKAIEPTITVMPQEAEVPENADVNELFADWEEARTEMLQQADDCERQALHLLSRAALLRAAVSCDDRGDGVLANELRAQAQDVAESSPDLRLVGINDDTPLECGA